VIVERPALERRVASSLDAGRIPVLLGGCGSGRTSLLLRLEDAVGRDRSQYLDMAAAATTPERCLAAVLGASRLTTETPAAAPADTRAAFLALLDYFDQARGGDLPPTFLLDEFLDIRTFESFPGLRHVQRELISRLAASRARFVLSSRFTARVHRALRDAPSTFEVIHVPPLDTAETQSLARLFVGDRRDWSPDTASAVVALSGGAPAAAHILLAGLSGMGPATDPVAALAAAIAPDGPLTARCRECYELRLHRARGYGALKAILGVLAETEPLNLTEISHRLSRTPGSTKDYLSWLEDVDLVAMRGKRYAFIDPLLRLYVRLYARPVPPSDDEIVREVGTYARARLLQGPPAGASSAGSSSSGSSPAGSTPAGSTPAAPVTPGTPAEPAAVRGSAPAAQPPRSGIIEID
jgi:hypothetical protein